MDTTGMTLGTYTLSNVTATDWEDIAVAPAPDGSSAVFIGDIGDNAARPGTSNARTEIQVYRIAEPVDLVFRAPGSVTPDQPTVLETLAALAIGTPGTQGALVTAGDISPTGDRVILRTYVAIWLWARAPGANFCGRASGAAFTHRAPG
jgi:hypothetical protein